LRPNDPEAALGEEDQRWNLQRLRSLTGLGPAAGSPLEGRVSWRLQTPDRLPLIGPAPRTDLPPGSRQDQVRFIARQPGLYVIGALGSRGLIWAPLAAQMLCAWVEATPMPLEADLVDALDPARWWVRQARLSRLNAE
jgi:tRNA 5-methylaminomethyl-2-thiouridine biosynthesis bifunctional protein